jgi:hypothetical protein
MSSVQDHADALAVKHVEENKEWLDKLKVLTNQQLREKSIDCLVLSGRVYNCLIKAGIKKVGGLEGITWPELLNIKRLGVYSSSQLIETMRYVGFIIASNDDPYSGFALSPNREGGKEPNPIAEHNPKLSEADKQWEKIEQHLDAVKQPAKAEPYWEKVELYSGPTMQDFYIHPETHELMIFLRVNYRNHEDFMLLVHQVAPHLFRVEDYNQYFLLNANDWTRRGSLFCFVWRSEAYLPFTPNYTLSDGQDARKLHLIRAESEDGRWLVFLEMAKGAVKIIKERYSIDYFETYAQDRNRWHLWPKK